MFTTLATWSKITATSAANENEKSLVVQVRYNPNSHIPHVVKGEKTDVPETICDGLRIYHNPFADNPIDPSIFRRDDVFQAYPNHEKKEIQQECNEGHLLFRNVYTIRKKK